MTPVMLLADGYMANASEPWLIPDVDDIGDMKVVFHTDPTDFHPFTRNDETLARVGPFRNSGHAASYWRH